MSEPRIARALVAYESLPWVMSGPLSGNLPVRVLCSDGDDFIVTVGLGPGVWNRVRLELEKKEVFDIDKILPLIWMEGRS